MRVYQCFTAEPNRAGWIVVFPKSDFAVHLCQTTQGAWNGCLKDALDVPARNSRNTCFQCKVAHDRQSPHQREGSAASDTIILPPIGTLRFTVAGWDGCSILLSPPRNSCRFRLRAQVRQVFPARWPANRSHKLINHSSKWLIAQVVNFTQTAISLKHTTLAVTKSREWDFLRFAEPLTGC